MREFSASGLERSRVNRCLLKLGTVLGSGALAAALLVPAAAQAADTSVRYQLATPVMQGTNTLPAGFRSAAAGVTPQDLTVRPLQRLTVTSGGGSATYSYSSDITTTADNTPGITANYAGAVTITAGNITTTGNYSDGISANTTSASSPAPISITVGNVSTSGNQSNGIYARTFGDLSITTGSVSTTGQMATGIYGSSAGNAVIKAGDINTSGNGVQANAGGQLSIAVGNVTSSSGTGISATAGGNINITATSVTASSTDIFAHSSGIYANSSGIYANSSGGNVNIKVGNVYATGSLVAEGVSAIGQNVTVTTGNVVGGLGGVYARAYNPYNLNDHSGAVNVTVNGEIYTKGVVSHGVTAASDGTVNVTTTGEISSTSLGFGPFHIPGAGIFAIGNGDVTVNAEGRIKTYGPATGIVGLSYTGDVSINASAINTYGKGSLGIRAEARYGAATVVAGDIILAANASTGIIVEAGSADITLNGQILAHGQFSNGILAEAYTGDLAIHNNGSITNDNALGGTGIFAAAMGNVVIDGQGSITTGKLVGGEGIVAISQAGSVSITQGAIKSGNYGVLAVAQNTNGNNAANGININVASVKTTGTGKAGTGIVAVDYNKGSTVTINAGSVTTIGDYANGITGIAHGGAVTITGGAISTRGKDASGVDLVGNAYDKVTLDSVATTGLAATAVNIQANPFAGGGAINVNIGSVSTAGDYALGVFAYHGTQTIQVGSVTTAGKQSLGIYAAGSGAGGATINAGSVATAGDQSIAILAKSGGSVSVTETGGITTQGNDASGVIAVGNGPVDLTLTGAISTKGGGSAGAVAVSNNAVNVQAGTISTAGGGSPALYAIGNSATVNLNSASTSGIKSPAVFVKGETGVTLTANQITTSGDDANALIIRSGGYGVIGNATVNVGSITTTGQHSAGVDAFTVGQSLTNPSQASTLSLTVGSITTTGIDSPGISAINTDGALNINASNISTKGAESTGILAFGGSGGMNIQAGSISTAGADAIYANGAGSGTISVGVSGKLAASGANGIVAINTGGATNITVASTGNVTGAADAIQIQSGGGPVTIANAGTITGGTGYAIDVTGLPQGAAASTRINNTGTIVGAVNLAGGGSNQFTNAGTFDATKDSFFGGAGVFVNTGVLKVLPGATAPGSVSFLGLASFQNAGGLIDLRNGHAGDVFTLTGNYVASGNARIGLDVVGKVADKLVILGTATGQTTLLIGGDPANASLLKKFTLVQDAPGSTGTFVLGNSNVGLIHYSLQPGVSPQSGAAPAAHGLMMAAAAPAPAGYSVTTSAGPPVYATMKLEESAQSIWRQSAEAWSENLAAMRGDAWGGGQGSGSGASARSGRYWVQAFGSTSDRNGTPAGLSVDYNQTDAGVQAGADLVRSASRLGNVSLGVTAGYTNSQIGALGGTLNSDIDTFDVGGYAVVNHGPYFANGLVKFDHHQISTSDSVVGYSANLSGESYGAQFEFGRRFGTERFAFEPTVSLTYVHTSLDNATIEGQTLAFDDEDGASAKVGGRFYANRTFAGTPFVFYAGAAAVDDFTGGQRATFNSGGLSQNVSADSEGAFGQAVAGMSARTLRDITLYLEAEGEFGGSHSGAGVRLGARF